MAARCRCSPASTTCSSAASRWTRATTNTRASTRSSGRGAERAGVAITRVPLGRRLALGLVGLALAAAGVWGGWLLVDARERARELDRLRAGVRDARVDAQTCQVELGRREEAFRRLDGRVDSLRSVVDRYEELDPRGVPRPEYQDYLTEVERYNRSVEAWETRAASLREAEESCRARVEHHNLLADSLRRWLAGEGLLEMQP